MTFKTEAEELAYAKGKREGMEIISHFVNALWEKEHNAVPDDRIGETAALQTIQHKIGTELQEVAKAEGAKND